MYYSLEFVENMAGPLFIFNVMFILGYYNGFTFVQRQIICQIFLNKIESIFIFITQSIDAQCSMLITWNIFSTFKFNFDCNEALFYKSKIYSYGVYVSKKEKRKEHFVCFQKEEM